VRGACQWAATTKTSLWDREARSTEQVTGRKRPLSAGRGWFRDWPAGQAPEAAPRRCRRGPARCFRAVLPQAGCRGQAREAFDDFFFYGFFIIDDTADKPEQHHFGRPLLKNVSGNSFREPTLARREGLLDRDGWRAVGSRSPTPVSSVHAVELKGPWEPAGRGPPSGGPAERPRAKARAVNQQPVTRRQRSCRPASRSGCAARAGGRGSRPTAAFSLYRAAPRQSPAFASDEGWSSPPRGKSGSAGAVWRVGRTSGGC